MVQNLGGHHLQCYLPLQQQTRAWNTMALPSKMYIILKFRHVVSSVPSIYILFVHFTPLLEFCELLHSLLSNFLTSAGPIIYKDTT